MFGTALVAVLLSQSPSEFWGGDVGLRIQKAPDGTLVESYLAKDAKGKMRVILTSPTIGNLGIVGKPRSAPLLQIGSEGLFEAPPTFAFKELKHLDARTITLAAQGEGYSITKVVTLPAQGQLVTVSVSCRFQRENPVIRYLLDTYAFAPDGKPMKAYGKPDATFAPGIRPRKDGVIGDHFFRSPVVTVQEGELAASIMPDIDVLKDNRYIPTIVDLDAANGVVDAPLISYGFADHKLTGHVYYANDSSMTRPAPPELLLGYTILLDAKAEPYGAYQKAAKWQWDHYGHRYLDKILPQAMPFEEYAKVCYPAAFNEKETGGWFEHEINGQICGGMPSGWGRHEGWVSWQPWFNQLRSAWGLRWWGKKTGNREWVEKADKMLNLALAAPMEGGAVPTTYQSKQKTWKGSLITPDPHCYYDLTNMAWKGIWMLRWLEFDDCPRKEEIGRQLTEMAYYMMKRQNKDGSFPTWLDKDHDPVPVLDHSAQTALPAWLLAEMLEPFKDETTKTKLYALDNLKEYRPGSAMRDRMGASILEAANFLVKNVVNQQLWYDFETFFSCSPKACLQRNGLIDDPKMHDPHTLQAPQNTLCMHWAAEALMRTADLLGSGDDSVRFRNAALKATDTMVLTQNVWPISYRNAAYTYGGFGVQNSDGEYNDARQAQFGDTLADFGAALGRQDYFERGVAAVRASMALINHPLHEKLGIYPNPNYPLGLQPENTGHGGTDQQNGRTGPDWGEMSGLTSMAWLLHKYGPAYGVKNGGKVVVDGGYAKPEPAPAPLRNPVFDMRDWRMPGWTFNGDFLHWPVKNPRNFNWDNGGLPFIGTCENGRGAFDDEFTGAIESPWFTSTGTIRLKVGGGAGEGVYVELLGGRANPQRIHIARGKNSETMEDIVWNVAQDKPMPLKIRIVDQEKGGWGHINVGNIRCN